MKEEIKYTSEIFDAYQSIAKQNASQKITFYKRHESFLATVPLDEKLDIVLDFHEALFELGHYSDYLIRCDETIELLFDSNLFPIFRKEAIQKLLFNKAGSQLNLHKLDQSEETMKALIKMDVTGDKLYKGLLFHIFKNKRLLLKFQARGIVISLILCSAILSIWIALVIQPHYPESLLRFKAWALGLFSLGILIWTGFIGYNNFQSYKEANKFLTKYRYT